MDNKKLFKEYGIEIYIFTGKNPCLSIKNSHLVQGEHIEKALTLIHTTQEYVFLKKNGYNRTFESEVAEWKAHNVLYRWGIARERTGTVDIDQNESKFRRFIYAILSKF